MEALYGKLTEKSWETMRQWENHRIKWYLPERRYTTIEYGDAADL